MKKNPIKKTGSFFELDGDGYIVNPASEDKIQEKWLPAVGDVKGEYLKHFDDKLHSVYIRGSVAKGEAVDDVSDIDSFAVISLTRDEIDTSWAKDFNKSLVSRYPFVTKVEISVLPIDEIENHRAFRIMLKTQSACVYGVSLADNIHPLKPNKDVIQHLQNIGREVEETMGWLQGENSGKDIQKRCAWIMKRLLRSGFELVIERSGKYTRDLYPCYTEFSKYHPEKESEMHKVLELAINPIGNANEIMNILDSIGEWVASEAKF